MGSVLSSYRGSGLALLHGGRLAEGPYRLPDASLQQATRAPKGEVIVKSDWLKILVQSVIMLAIGSALAAFRNSISPSRTTA